MISYEDILEKFNKELNLLELRKDRQNKIDNIFKFSLN